MNSLSHLADLYRLGYVGDDPSESISLEALGLLFLLLARKANIERIDAHTREMTSLPELLSAVHSIRQNEHWSSDSDFMELVQELREHSSNVLSTYFGDE